jgi:FkbM family methyltransferase
MTAIAQSLPAIFALRTACAGLRTVFHYAPWHFGKQWLWERIVHRYIIWRDLPIVARTRFGARLEGSFPDAVHSYVYFFGVWEPAITALYRAALKPGDVVIDIGANVGLHTLLASGLVGPKGRVHAIEASPWIHARLLRNLTANGARNVTTYNMAATAEPSQVGVYLHDTTNLGGTTIVAEEAARSGAAFEAMIEGRPLSQIVPMEELLAARLIKIDVEGAEWLVAQGMVDLLPRLRADVDILIEVKPDALAALGASLEMFLALFERAGFVAYEIENSYQPADYMRPSQATPQRLRRRDFAMADLLFRRAPQPLLVPALN